MSNYLEYIASILIALAFIFYFFLAFLNCKKKITDSTGFDITKDLLSSFDRINIIENKSFFTYYHIKRRIIKLASKCYYGNTVSDIGIALIEAGISGIDDYKNKAINFLRSIIPNLKYLYALPILAIGVNSVTYNVSDAKASLAFVIFMAIMQYLMIDIKTKAISWLDDNMKQIKDINNDGKHMINTFINRVLLIDKAIFIAELIIIIRCVAIIIY